MRPWAQAVMQNAVLRRAERRDARALVDLRALMFRSMGVDVAGDGEWRTHAYDWFTASIDADDICIAIVEDGTGMLYSSAMGQIRKQAPSPANPSGLIGQISNIATIPSARRKGYAQACLRSVIDWFADETDVQALELFATNEGMPMYLAAGFTLHRYPAMRMNLAH